MLVVDEGAVGPKLTGDFFTGEELAGALEEHEEDLKGLDVDLDTDTLAAKLSGGCVGLEDSEAIAPSLPWVGHSGFSLPNPDGICAWTTRNILRGWYELHREENNLVMVRESALFCGWRRHRLAS